MANLFLVLTFVVLVAIIGIAIAAVLLAGKRRRELSGRDYRIFFYVGLIYLLGGIALSLIFPSDVSYFNFFVFMGIIFTAMGLANFDKWKKK